MRAIASLESERKHGSLGFFPPSFVAQWPPVKCVLQTCKPANLLFASLDFTESLFTGVVGGVVLETLR